jgi:hypothetical protein
MIGSELLGSSRRGEKLMRAAATEAFIMIAGSDGSRSDGTIKKSR